MLLVICYIEIGNAGRIRTFITLAGILIRSQLPNLFEPQHHYKLVFQEGIAPSLFMFRKHVDYLLPIGTFKNWSEWWKSNPLDAIVPNDVANLLPTLRIKLAVRTGAAPA